MMMSRYFQRDSKELTRARKTTVFSAYTAVARIADLCYCLEITFHVLASLSLLQSKVVDEISANWSLINCYDLTISYLEKIAPDATIVLFKIITK